MRHARAWTVLLASVAYVVVGIGTAILAGVASSPTGVKAWRLAAWLLSLILFAIHFAVERHGDERRRRVAVRVAVAVAFGAFGVALLGPIRSHWDEAHLPRLMLLSIVAWPVLTGAPAFLVALLAGFVLDRVTTGTQPSRSRVI